jgi:hypothetical protein
MDFNDLHDSIKLTAKLAKDNYDARNAIIDRMKNDWSEHAHRLQYIAGECSHYFPLYNQEYHKIGEVTLYCKCSPIVKGGIRYSYTLNGKTIARSKIAVRMMELGV